MHITGPNNNESPAHRAGSTARAVTVCMQNKQKGNRKLLHSKRKCYNIHTELSDLKKEK